MSSITSYKTTAFKESQKFLVIDPSTQSPSLVLGSDLVSYITPMLNYVRADSTRLSAENTDYDVGTLVQTSGATSPGDNFAATYLVVEGGSGDFPMLNGNDLLVIKGDEFLREQLISNDAGEGSDLVAHTGTSDTVTEALDKRTIYIGSVAELASIPAPADGNQFSVASFWPGLTIGGGSYVWRANRLKSDHNGGTIIDPDKLSSLETIGSSTPFGPGNAYFSPASSGQGCFELVDAEKIYIGTFGAVNDGSEFDNSVVLGAAHSAYSTVWASRGDYRFLTPYYSGTQKQVIGDEPQSRNSISVVFRLRQSDFGLKGVAFKPAGTVSGNQVQSCAMENITFIGDLDVNTSDLSTIADSGVIAVDFAGVKDGSSLKGCHFRNLNEAIITPNAGGQFTDTLDLSGVTIQRCRNAFTITTTLPVLADGLEIWDCYDWGYCRYLSSGQVTFNNSNFSSETCGIKGISCDLGGVWFEGGNRQIQYQKAKVRSGYMSEAYSLGNKFHFLMDGDNSVIDIGPVRLGTNTRLVDIDNVTNPESCVFRIKNAYNCDNFAALSDYRTYVRAGYQFDMYAPLCGDNIAGREWVFSNLRKHTILGASDVSGDVSGLVEKSFKKSARKLLADNLTFTIECNPDFVSYGSSFSRFEYIKLSLIGGSNDSPTSLNFYKELTIVKAGDDSWAVYDDGDTSAFSIALSSPTTTSVDVTISINHAGVTSGDLIFATDASENVSISW